MAKHVAKKKPSSEDRATAASVLAWLERNGSTKVRKAMARYAIPSDMAFGVSVGAMRKEAKHMGPDHDLAEELWQSGWYEARMMACFLGEPQKLTAAGMDRWRRDFDSWAICDTACFALFDRSPLAWKRIGPWSKLKDEFGKRAAFTLIASLSVHDKACPDERFAECLPIIEREASDERNFVKKAVNWALRSIGKRSRELHAAAVATSERLALSPAPAARWIGKDALRELSGASVARRLEKRNEFRSTGRAPKA